MITYNHEKYILKALNSIISQSVYGFNVELIISDDCSVDNTWKKIDEAISDLPGNITLKLFRHEKNKGMMENFSFALSQCTGKYIALCEGDDYWTDTEKLRLQIEFMESNPDFSICFHNADIINPYGEIGSFCHLSKTIFSGDDLLRQWLMPTASVMIRNKISENIPEYFRISTHGDLALFLFIAQFGKIKYLNRTMSAYRLHQQGVTRSVFKGIEHNSAHIDQCIAMANYFYPNYKSGLQKRISEYCISTSYLYARNKKKAMSKKFFRQALKSNSMVVFKKFKYTLRIGLMLIFLNEE